MKPIFWILIISWLLPSCMIFKSPSKKDEIKDTKAIARVLADKNLADLVYYDQAKMHPCSDSIIKFLPGRRDSIPYPVFVMDSLRLNRTADSIRNIYKENNLEEALRQAAKAGYDQGVAEYAKRKMPLPVHDTIYREDGRIIDAWKHDAQTWKEKFIAQEAVNISAKEANKGTIRLQWWLAILFAVVFLAIGYGLSKIR